MNVSSLMVNLSPEPLFSVFPLSFSPFPHSLLTPTPLSLSFPPSYLFLSVSSPSFSSLPLSIMLSLSLTLQLPNQEYNIVLDNDLSTGELSPCHCYCSSVSSLLPRGSIN